MLLGTQQSRLDCEYLHTHQHESADLTHQDGKCSLANFAELQHMQYTVCPSYTHFPMDGQRLLED